MAEMKYAHQKRQKALNQARDLEMYQMYQTGDYSLATIGQMHRKPDGTALSASRVLKIVRRVAAERRLRRKEGAKA